MTNTIFFIRYILPITLVISALLILTALGVAIPVWALIGLALIMQVPSVVIIRRRVSEISNGK